MESTNAIEVKNLLKSFGPVKAIDGITFEIRRGEIFGFLGPNGAGKTTTIRMLTGLLTPDSGQVLIDGLNIKSFPILAKTRVGVIPETSNIYVDLTAKQNIVLAGKFYGINKRRLEKKADILLEKFALAERKNQEVKYFSKGLRQRVSIAAALVHEPGILFLDEPTSGLDVQSQRLLRNIIREFNEKGATIFLTTHNIEEANSLCERIGVINKGEIAAIDTPEKLRRTFEKSQSVEFAFEGRFEPADFTDERLISKTEKIGDKWKMHTDNPDELVKKLTHLAAQRNIKFTHLQTCGPSLEDVYITLTERKNDGI